MSEEQVVEPKVEPAQDDFKAKYEATLAESRKWEQRAKENKTAAERLAEIEEASKTELQKALDRAELAESKLTKIETEKQVAQWRTDVAEAAGVPADVLVGDTKEALEAHAEVLKPFITPSRGPHVPDAEKTPSHSSTDEATFVRGFFGAQN